MQDRKLEEEIQAISNRERLEVLEAHTTKITSILDGVTNTMVELRVAMYSSTEENQKVLEAIKRETNSTLE